MRSGKRGFTLIELSVTVAVLTLCAAIVAPGFARIKEQMAAQDFMPSVARIMADARETSINMQVPLIVSFDDSTNSLQITSDQYQNSNPPLPADGVNAPPSGTPAGGISTPTPSLQFPSQTLKAQALPQGATTETFQLAGKDSSSADFRMRFYPDGTCDSGGITFRFGNSEKSVYVDKLGFSKLNDGPLPDPKSTTWEAGSLVQRSQ